jgi:hypothetical protein
MDEIQVVNLVRRLLQSTWTVNLGCRGFSGDLTDSPGRVEGTAASPCMHKNVEV